MIAALDREELTRENYAKRLQLLLWAEEHQGSHSLYSHFKLKPQGVPSRQPLQFVDLDLKVPMSDVSLIMHEAELTWYGGILKSNKSSNVIADMMGNPVKSSQPF